MLPDVKRSRVNLPAGLFGALLLVGWLVPDRFPPWQAFHNEAPVFAALILLAWGVRLWQTTAAVAVLIWLPLLMVVAVWMQWAVGLLPFAGDAYVASVYLLGLSLALAIGFKLGRSKDGFNALTTSLATSFAAGAILVATMSWIQFLEIENYFLPWIMTPRYPGRAVGNLGQPNQAATLMLMGLVALVLVWETGRLGNRLTVLLATLISSGIVLTQSRAGLLSAVCLVMLWHLWPRKAAVQPRLRGYVIWLWVMMLLAVALSQPLWGETLVDTGAVRPIGDTVNLRPLMWKQMLAAVADSPWVGYGWLQTATAHQVGAMQVPGLEQTNYAHNLVLDLMLWLGVPAALTATVIVACWFVRRFLRVRTTQHLLYVAWLVPLGVHSMLELPFAYSYLLFPAGLIIGLIASFDSVSVSGNLRLGVERWQTAASVLLGGILLLYSILVLGLGYEYQKVEEDFRVVRFENMRVGQTPVEYEPPRVNLLTQWRTVLSAMRLRAQPGMSPEELNVLHDASARYSWAALHFRYALALALNERPKEAAQQLSLLKNLYGEELYKEVRENWRRLATEHPTLNDIRLP